MAHGNGKIINLGTKQITFVLQGGQLIYAWLWGSYLPSSALGGCCVLGFAFFFSQCKIGIITPCHIGDVKTTYNLCKVLSIFCDIKGTWFMATSFKILKILKVFPWCRN